MLRVQQSVKQWYYRYYSLWACLLHDCSCCFVRVEKEKERMCMRKLASQTNRGRKRRNERKKRNKCARLLYACVCMCARKGIVSGALDNVNFSRTRGGSSSRVQMFTHCT